ncbi:MAG: hypothetical protein K9M54_04385 [Kiritimatiellales bacterium]|nr:hypothetical protein [Kiritimatiellales bacterium]
MTKPVHLSGLLVAVLIVLLPGCISVRSQRDADPYVLHHRNWWNYYQRGRLYLRDGKYDAARADFETALGRIPGARYPYAMERWRARTYGMHMMEGYFPHRELGICLYELDQPQAALDLLETSMQTEPSARAKFYINRIRKQLAMAAAPPPGIGIAPLPDWTSQRTVLVQGTVYGSNLVSSLAIDNKPEFIELATPRMDFRRELPLHEGRNLIRVVAEDVSGKQTATNLVLMADWTPPEIHLRHAGAALSISCEDNLGLHQLEINGNSLPPVRTEYTLDYPPTNGPLQVAVSDHAGNRMEWTLAEKELLHLAQHNEATPPRLILADAGKTITLFNPEYMLDLRAEDDTALRAVELNGENLLTRNSPLFRTLRRIPLNPGTNRLELIAEDNDGNRTGEQINVVYRQPEYMDRIYRLATTLSPLAGEIPDPAFGRRINDLIGQELTLDPVRFYLLAAKDETQQLQKEQALSGSDLADPRALLKQGRQLASDLVFVTRILSDGPGQTVYTQVLDTQSGEALFIEDVYVEDPSLLPRQIGGLVMKIEQRFPLILAGIRQQDNRLVIDAGETSGAQKGMRFLVIRSEGSLKQGHVLQAGDHPVELVISEVESENSRVIMPRRGTNDSGQPGDYAFSR